MRRRDAGELVHNDGQIPAKDLSKIEAYKFFPCGSDYSKKFFWGKNNMSQSQTITFEDFLPSEVDDNEQITFTGLEWKFFVAELKDMIAVGEFDIAKVIHSARFYAEMTRRKEQIKAGHWVEHDLIEVDDDE